MPGQHNENTKLLGFYADLDLVKLVDQLRGVKGRSQFLRDATIEYMERRQVKVPERAKTAPDRAGKGGPTRNKANSKVAARARSAAKRAADAERTGVRLPTQ